MSAPLLFLIANWGSWFHFSWESWHCLSSPCLYPIFLPISRLSVSLSLSIPVSSLPVSHLPACLPPHYLSPFLPSPCLSPVSLSVSFSPISLPVSHLPACLPFSRPCHPSTCVPSPFSCLPSPFFPWNTMSGWWARRGGYDLWVWHYGTILTGGRGLYDVCVVVETSFKSWIFITRSKNCFTLLKKYDAWRETAMTEKRRKKHPGDASVKRHDVATRQQKYDACPAP